MRILSVLLCLSSPAFGEDCPAAADHGAAQVAIYEGFLAATTEAEARALSSQLWLMWLEAPDARAQEMLDRGMQQREGFDFAGSRRTLDGLVDYCPDYAEGYNQRAFASFLSQDFQSALLDLDVTLSINPRHLGALSGKALTLMGLGREEEAQTVLREALKLNPWLSERSLLSGTDI